LSRARPPTIAVASGKGGTGKTTLAAHLALVSSRLRPTILVDLDVEAPDARGYFREAEAVGELEAVRVPVPSFEAGRCSGCGACARVCRFGAIVAIGASVTVNERLCKGCGRCEAACPSGALSEKMMEVGTTAAFRSDGLGLFEGRLAVGDIRSTAVIEAAKRRSASAAAGIQIRDCPPGVSCPATHAIEGADYAILVAEPTEFSRHDLEAALRLVRDRGMRAGTVINKDGFGNADIEGLCALYGVPIIGRLAFTRERAASGAVARLWRDDSAVMREAERILRIALSDAAPGAGGRE
jgi:MinD superfamily P-loop ATPase